jgi:acylphosphatase
MPRAHFYIEGDVQGVGFRAYADREARRLGLTGWVKNSEGGVEVVAEGTKEKLEQLRMLLQKGPHGADVESVQVVWEKETGEFGDFEVRA